MRERLKAHEWTRTVSAGRAGAVTQTDSYARTCAYTDSYAGWREPRLIHPPSFLQNAPRSGHPCFASSGLVYCRTRGRPYEPGEYRRPSDGFRPCAMCGDEMDDQARSDRKTCSPACRTALYRRYKALTK